MAVCRRVLQHDTMCVAVCCSVLQCVAVFLLCLICRSRVLQCLPVCCSVSHCVAASLFHRVQPCLNVGHQVGAQGGEQVCVGCYTCFCINVSKCTSCEHKAHRMKA